MSEQTGTFYAVSVGPGDPELLTLQAVRVLENTPVIAAPQTASGQMLALDIMNDWYLRDVSRKIRSAAPIHDVA